MTTEHYTNALAQLETSGSLRPPSLLGLATRVAERSRAPWGYIYPARRSPMICTMTTKFNKVTWVVCGRLTNQTTASGTG